MPTPTTVDIFRFFSADEAPQECIINATATDFFHVTTNLKIQICSELKTCSDNSADSVQYMKYSVLLKTYVINTILLILFHSHPQLLIPTKNNKKATTMLAEDSEKIMDEASKNTSHGSKGGRDMSKLTPS